MIICSAQLWYGGVNAFDFYEAGVLKAINLLLHATLSVMDKAAAVAAARYIFSLYFIRLLLMNIFLLSEIASVSIVHSLVKFTSFLWR